MFFVKGGNLSVCSGELLNDIPGSGTPFFLTAHHCFSTQSVASTLEVAWDYTQQCNGPVNDPTITAGATLLAASKSSDFTLLRLNDIPTGRAFLGWDPRPSAAQAGTVLHRLSHPRPDSAGGPLPQGYSQHLVLGTPPVCPAEDGYPTNDLNKFLNTSTTIGATFGGSSGAPLMTDGGRVVGQLHGVCTVDGEPCSPLTDFLDGRFTETYPKIAQFLDPDSGGGGGGGGDGGDGGDGGGGGGDGAGDPQPPRGEWLSTPALPGFEAKVRINNSITGSPEGDCIPETLCVSGALPGRPEIFVKVIGPRPNGFLWSQISRFTPAQVEVWLRQTSSNATNYYILEAVGGNSDNVSGLQDREAFSP